jgi:hypothetical protein
VTRHCSNCGFENPPSRNPNDVWCRRCRAFLGFPTLAPSSAGLALALRGNLPVTAVPGDEASLPLSVRSTGTVVDEVTFSVSEAVRSWVRVVPERLNLYPGDTASLDVLFAPPRSPEVSAGRHEFELVARSREARNVPTGDRDHDEGRDPDEEEDRLPLAAVVAPFVELAPTLVPVRSAGPAGGSHRLLVENKGNHPSEISTSASDPDELLDFHIYPEQVTLGAGASTEIVVAVKPKRPLAGTPSRSMAFAVAVEPTETFASPPAPVGGIHVQEAEIGPLRVLLAERELRGRPGQDVGTFATVRNTAPATESLHFNLLGPVSAWGRVVPETLVAAPDTEIRVEVALTLPPPGSGTEGWLPWGVRCVPSGDNDRAASAEGGVTVEPLDGVELRVLPSSTRGRWFGRFLVTIRNAGARDGRWRVVGVDPKDELSFAFSRTAVDLRPGADTVVAAKVRGRRPVLGGRTRHHRFTFAAVRAGKEESGALWGRDKEAEATFEQVPVLSFTPPRLPGPPPLPALPPPPIISPEAEVAPWVDAGEGLSDPGDGWGQLR